MQVLGIYFIIIVSFQNLIDDNKFVSLEKKFSNRCLKAKVITLGYWHNNVLDDQEICLILTLIKIHQLQ